MQPPGLTRNPAEGAGGGARRRLGTWEGCSAGKPSRRLDSHSLTAAQAQVGSTPTLPDGCSGPGPLSGTPKPRHSPTASAAPCWGLACAEGLLGTFLIPPQLPRPLEAAVHIHNLVRMHSPQRWPLRPGVPTTARLGLRLLLCAPRPRLTPGRKLLGLHRREDKPGGGRSCPQSTGTFLT